MYSYTYSGNSKVVTIDDNNGNTPTLTREQVEQRIENVKDSKRFLSDEHFIQQLNKYRGALAWMDAQKEKETTDAINRESN
jgi:hypothetical protein